MAGATMMKTLRSPSKRKTSGGKKKKHHHHHHPGSLYAMGMAVVVVGLAILDIVLDGMELHRYSPIDAAAVFYQTTVDVQRLYPAATNGTHDNRQSNSSSHTNSNSTNPPANNHNRTRQHRPKRRSGGNPTLEDSIDKRSSNDTTTGEASIERTTDGANATTTNTIRASAALSENSTTPTPVTGSSNNSSNSNNNSSSSNNSANITDGDVETQGQAGNATENATATTTTTDNKNAMHTNTTTNATQDEPAATAPVLTILVGLSGEFGNNLFKVIRGWGTAKLAEREFGLTTRLVFNQQRRGGGKIMGKALTTTRHTQKCMAAPAWFRADDFTIGNRLVDAGYFSELPLGDLNLSDEARIMTIPMLTESLRKVSEYLRDHPAEVRRTNQNLTAGIPRLMVPVASLHVTAYVNEFYDDLREAFVFDRAACCGPKTLADPPGPDEAVLHYRNFATEMKEWRRASKGFLELGEDRLAHEVLGHLQEGDKVAIAGRNLEADAKKNTTLAYKLTQALSDRKLAWRFAPQNDPMGDFCFLLKTQRELIGTAKSTYVQLAAFWMESPTAVARLYQYYTPAVQQKGSALEKMQASVGSDNWTHPALQSRVRFEYYYPINETTTNTTNKTTPG